MGKKKKIVINDEESADHSSSEYHIPVLLKEAVDGLQVRPGGIYVDCTFGGGGHSKAILERLGENGKLIVFDQDESARQNLPDDERVVFVPHNFRHLQRFLRLHKIQKADGVLADLGVSSHQFDEAERGFSIRYDAELDMRMDRRQNRTAADLLEELTEQELHRLFEQYGEVTNSRTLAKTIVQQRQASPLKTIQQFKNAVQHVVKGNPNKYFARVFQALRIAVNDELGALREMLQQLPSILRPDGRIAIITFHSLEDRIVKNFFKSGSFNESETDSVYGGKAESPFIIITKKPVVASDEEVKQNPRARSAKLRMASLK